MMSDSPVLYTGFGRVLKKIALHVFRETNWQLKVIGWFNHRSDKDFFPFDIIPTNIEDPMDKFGLHTFDKVVEDYKPDLVFAIGDEWMVRHAVTSKYRNTYKLVLYCPIDGSPIPADWLETFNGADVMVAYGEFGKRVMQSRDNSIKVEIIPHGVDLSVYRPKENVKRPKKALENAFFIGCVARNQPRKMLPRLLKMFSLFVKPWIKCNKCGITTSMDTSDRCGYCGSVDIIGFPAKDDAYLYLHCSQNDLSGWDILELCNRLEIGKKVMYPRNNVVGTGVPDFIMADFYNMFDVFTLPTSGEGFGLPILEAMACGTPTLVTNYSGHLDFCKGVSELIAVSEYVTEPKTNIERAIVDISDYVIKMDKFYYDKETFLKKWQNFLEGRYSGTSFQMYNFGFDLRRAMSEESLNRVKLYDWRRILPQWVKLFVDLIGIDEKEDKKVKIKIREI